MSTLKERKIVISSLLEQKAQELDKITAYEVKLNKEIQVIYGKLQMLNELIVEEDKNTVVVDTVSTVNS